MLLGIFISISFVGFLFGVQHGVDYSHVKLAFYFLSIPILIFLITLYLFFCGLRPPRLIHYSYLALATFYSSFAGGGFAFLVNRIGAHDNVVLTGPIVTMQQHSGYRRPSFFVEFQDGATTKILKVELTSYEYNRLRVGDIYTETMYVGSLGLLYRVKRQQGNPL